MTSTLIEACNRLLQTQQEVMEMPSDQRDWFLGKPGHADCFVVARAMKDLLENIPAEVCPDSYRMGYEAACARYKPTVTEMQLPEAARGLIDKPATPSSSGKDSLVEQIVSEFVVQEIIPQWAPYTPDGARQFAKKLIVHMSPYLQPAPVAPKAVIDKERFISEIYEEISAVRYYSRKQMLERIYNAMFSKGWLVQAVLRAAGMRFREEA
jgi:hypothetical protein